VSRTRPATPLLPALFGLLLVACGGEETVDTVGPEILRLGADQVLVDAEHFITRQGLRRARLEADTMYFLRDDTRVRIVPLELTFYDPADGGSVSRVTAREGIYDTRTQDMEAIGEVEVLDHREGQRLLTEHLEYINAADELRSDRDFVLYRRDGVLRGTGFVSDPAMDSVRVLRPAGHADAVDGEDG
jgi:LPS export ABC transporter protein LptC